MTANGDSSEPPTSVVTAVTTEHFALQSARGAATSEAAARLSGMLATVSAALVATGFLAGTPAASGFFVVVIPALVLLGVLTYRRLVEIGVEDVLFVRAIQNIRHWYATQLPPGLPASMRAAEPERRTPVWSLAPTRTPTGVLPLLLTSASVAALVTSLLAGTGTALLTTLVTDGIALPALTAAVTALLAMVGFTAHQAARFQRIG